MQLRLTNPTNRPQTFTLRHNQYCAFGGPCECVRESYKSVAYDRKTGAVGYATNVRIKPRTVTIPPKKSVGGLTDAIYYLPGVKDWIKRGVVRAVVIQPTPVAASIAQKVSPKLGEEVESRGRHRRRNQEDDPSNEE